MSIKRIFRKLSNRISNTQSSNQIDRKGFLKSIPENLKILEIGPFYTPMHRGENVKYFDVLDREQLVERAKQLDLSYKVENIPHIHYVSPTADLTIVDEKFDAIFSSHVIEHQFDLIDHLQKASHLLSNGGKYYLIIPDKRFCFDHYQQTSTIVDVIIAHREKRTKHSLKNVLEHRAFLTHNVAVDHWNGKHGELTGIADNIKNAIAEYDDKDYIDVHSLFFTPTSFVEIMNLLNELAYIDFKVAKAYDTAINNIEFCCVLEKVTDK